MPEVIDTTKATPATPDILLNFQAAKGTEHNTLGSISQSIIPNYDVNKAAEYVNQPSFNTLDPKEGYSEMENQMSIGQSSLEQWRNGLSKAVANIPLKFMEGMGYAYGFGKWGISSGFDVKNIDDMINNDFATFFHNTSKELDKSLPIYGSFDYQDGNILQKMSTAKFWAGDFTDGLAFLASAYGGSFIGKGIGKAVGGLGEALGATVETANTINKYTSYGAGTIYNTISESGFEAKDNYDLVYPLVKDKISKELRTKYTDETTGQLVISEEQLANEIEQESRLKAGQSAANVFTSNLAILSISSAWEMKAFLGNPIDDSKRLFRQIARGEIKEGEIQAWKSAAKGLGVGIVFEGFWEEGMQNAMQQFQTKKALGKTDKNGFTGGYFDEWIKGWSTTEGQASMILGALIGGPFQAMSHFSEAKEKIEHINFLTDQVEKQRNAIVASDKIYESYLKNRYKKDEAGKLILNENNEPVLNEDWYKEKAFQIQLDQDYRTEKLNSLLDGNISNAKIVDEYYKSRKMWAYLSNPIYENSKEAIEAFKANLETQANEYQEITRHINDEKKQAGRNAAGELETVAPAVPNKDELEKQTFKKDLLSALADADAIQLEYDNVQKNIKLNPSNSKDSFLYEKLNKALFHEAIKRRALNSLLQDDTLTEEVKKDILNLIDSSNNFSKELSTKEGREKYIGEVKSQQDVLNDKIKEFNDVLDKYKTKPAEEVKKTKFDKIKDKTKSLAKPIITRFQKKQSEATIPIEEPVTPTAKAESYTEEDKTKLRKLNYEISNHIYREGQGYLTRINDAYGNETTVGKKYQFYKELGEEQLRKSKVKDVIDKTLNQIDLLLDSQTINKKNYEELIAKLSELYSQLNEFSKKYNEDKNYTLTNFTKEDLDYLNQIIKEVKNTLEGYDELIDNSIKQVKEQLSQFNEYISNISNVTDNMLSIIDNLYEGDFSIEKEDVNMDVYNALGEDLLYLSFIHTYFITNEDIERAKNQAIKGINLEKNIFITTELYKAGEMSYDEASNILSNFIAENSVVKDSDELFNLKKQEANRLLMAVPEIDAAQYFTLTNQLEDLNDIKNSFANNKERLNNELQTVFETSSKNVNKNKFLQLGDKPESLQNEFYESLYIEEENKDVVFNAIDYIVTKFEKDFKDKNETELSKIEDVIFYQNNLEELKFLNNILEEKDIKSKQLFDTKKSIDNFIKVLEDHIIPLAIKNQNNRKVFQEISLNVRDKNYFNQLGLNIEIDLEGKIILNGTSIKLVDLISKLYGQDLKDIKLSEKFNFINVEKIIDVLKSKSEEELKPLFDLIESLSKATAEDIRTFENTRGQKVFFSNTNFINYLENPDSVIERLIYDMSDFNNTASRTYGDKENWYSSPLYNYSKHLSPALLLDELKKKRFSGSMIMPYDKLAAYIELHLEYTALFNLKKNLGSKLDYKNYYVNLREEFEKNAITPTYQQEIALREAYEWWNNPSLLISYLKGIAGCLAYGTKVLMYDGSFKEVQDIVEGDILMGPDSTPRNVLSTAQGIDEMYKINQVNGISYTVNSEHILSLKEVFPAKYSRKTLKDGTRINNKNKILRKKSIQVKNISVKDYLKLYNSNLKKHGKGYQSEAIDFGNYNKMPIDPYYLGLWLGDGHTDNICSITNIDKEIIDYLENIGIHRKHDITYTIIDTNNIKSNFKKLYNLNNLSKLKQKYIPNIYLTSSIEDRLQLLAGLLDADGNYNNKGYEITQKHKILSENIEFLCRSLGFKINTVEKIVNSDLFKKKNLKYYRSFISVDKVIPCKIFRKQNKLRTQVKNIRHTGITIEPQGIGKYYGFTLDADNLFLLEDFTVTHNTGKTSVVLKYFIETNKINLDNIILSAHEQSQVDTLKKTLSDTTSAFVLADLLTKDVAFFDKTQLLVIDEINANSEQVMAQILNKLTEINLTREENNKLKLMLLGDPTQLKASNIPFINYFTNENNKYSVKYSNFLKVFSPLTVAYRSDVGAVNNLSNTFRDTNKPIENIDVQSSATITDIEAKGVILTSTERSNGTLDSIINRITTIKDVNSTKAIIVANQETVELYNKQLALKGITGVEVVTITRAQGRTFDEAYIDIQKDKLKSTPLGLANKNDFEYFYNTAMYTAISRAKNLVLLFDNSGTFTHSINTDVLDTNKDLTKEKEELKSNMQKYLDFADRMYAIPKEEKPKTKPEEKIKEEEKEEEKEVETEEEIIEDELEEDVPGLGEEIILEEEPEVLTFETSDDIHEIQNPQVQVLEETKALGEIVPAVAQIGNEVIYMKSSDGNIYAYVKSSRNPDLYEFLTIMYYDNLRDDVPSEKSIKDAYNKNSVKNLIKYSKESLSAASYNKALQIASGKLSYTQKLQFKYDTVENRSKVEKEIEEKGGLYNYLKEKLYPLVLKKGSDTDTYGDLVNFRVFVATRQDRNNEIPDSITDLKYGHPYLKFQVEKKDKEGKIRLQSFFVKLEAPMLKRTDSIIQPLITFNNSIKNIQNTFEDIGISISLKDEALHDLVLLFRKDFRAEESGISKDKKGNEIPGYKIVQKDETIITKEDVYKVLESYNLSDENLSKVLAIMQKESVNLVPILFSAKKDKIKVSALGYIKFLEEEAAKGTIKLEDTTEYFQFIEELSKGITNKQVNDIILNKVALNTINVIKSLRASNIELGEVSENLRRDVQDTRKDLTARSFVPIISGPNQGKFYALDPIIGQVVVIDTIPERRFVSQSYTTKNNIGMFDFEDLRLTRNNSKLQTNFNILARANGVLNKGTQNEIKIRLSYKVNKGTDQERAITFAPILIKDSKYDSNFDRGYYGILKLAFNNLIDQKKRNKEPFEFDLKYTDDGGNVIQFQYKEQLGKDGKSIWKDPTRIGKFRREASLQHENALEVMKNFLIEQKATFENGEVITQEALDKLENEKTKVDITTEDLDSMIGDSAFDESGTSLNYRKNVDRDYIYSSQDTSHGGSKFEDNIPLQNAVTTRLNKVLPSRAQVKLNGVQTKTEEPIKPKEKPKKIERKTILEKGNYTLDQMENGKYRIFDNGENPQELYEYEDMNEAIDKFNSMNTEVKENITSTVLNKESVEWMLDSIVQSEELDENEKEAYGRRLTLLFDKNPQDTLNEFISKVADTFDVEKSIIKEYVEGEQAKKNCL